MGGRLQGAWLQEGMGWEPAGPALPWRLSEARGGKARLRLADSGPQAKEKELDFGNVLVNSTQSRLLVLLNDGNCTLYYRLYLEQCSPKVMGSSPPGTWAWAGTGPREAGRGGQWLKHNR